MDSSAASIPPWLLRHLQQAGGSVAFSRYMDWVLNDPEGGYYGSGIAAIGPQGDFATSPSLGEDFGALLASQLAEWLQLLSPSSETLSVVDIGPGEGDLVVALAASLPPLCPEFVDRLELVLVERNPGMMRRQQERLAGLTTVPVRWCSWAELQRKPVRGVLVAHELLDALPVERLIKRGEQLRLQTVALTSDQSLQFQDALLPDAVASEIASFAELTACAIPPQAAEEGWSSEWHSSLAGWMCEASAALTSGWLLVIDYALEAARYYHPLRSEGTLMTYFRQRAGVDPLAHPGELDITAHLCIESVQVTAAAAGWTCLDRRRQGEALLALGLAQRLHALQMLPPSQLSEALQRREALLRLVDPGALGEFRWLLFGRGVEARFSDAEPSGNSGSPRG